MELFTIILLVGGYKKNIIKNNRPTHLNNPYICSKIGIMDTFFKGENILEFVERFKDDQSCMDYLAEIKWSESYQCKRCGNAKYFSVSKHCSRECTKCKYIESATANTLFHKVKFGLRKAFMIVFEMSCTTKDLSSVQMSKRYAYVKQQHGCLCRK